MKKNQPKKTDVEILQTAFKTMIDQLKASSVEPAMVYSAMWSYIIGGYIHSGASYEEFCNQCERAKKTYEEKAGKEKTEYGMD